MPQASAGYRTIYVLKMKQHAISRVIREIGLNQEIIIIEDMNAHLDFDRLADATGNMLEELCDGPGSGVSGGKIT